jgi:pimeloyl-ACP methyl ester carboxylesterase
MAGLSNEAAVADGGEFLTTHMTQKLEAPLKRLYVGSEIALSRALELESDHDAAAQGYFLRAAYLSYQGMLSDECKLNVNLLCDNFKVYYLRSIVALLQILKNNQWDEARIGTVQVGNDEHFTLGVRHDKKYEAPESYETITASALIGTEGLANRHIRYGMGLPLTACRGRHDDEPLDRYLPRVGTCLPLTAVLNFKNGSNNIEATMEFHNAFNTPTVTIGNRTMPLAANFTSPFASIVEKTGLGDFDGLFNAFSGDEKLLHDTGFYSVEPYAEGKIPLITVHGLFSSPATWISLHNDLMGDPYIRDHYQVWHYLYPTNLPILENAKTFREKLDELEHHLQSINNGKGLRGMVLIAHSMGGLLTRTAVAKEDTSLMASVLASPDKLRELDVDSQKELTDMLSFIRKPYIDRVIFVATPHRGSPIAESWIGWIGKSLISLPKTIVQRTVSMTSKIKNILKPELASQLEGQDPTSVKGLSPKSPAIQVLAKVAVAGEVPFHSIIGNEGKPGPVLESSDGVVLYTSSHLEGAQSELVVPADHSAHTHPLAVQEIKRILYLNLDEVHTRETASSKRKKK